MNSKRRPSRVRPQPTSNSTQSQMKNDPSLPARSLKRKKSSSSPAVPIMLPGPSFPANGVNGRNSEKAENRVPAASKSTVSSSRQPPTRIFDAMGRPPSLERDLSLREHSNKDKGIAEEPSKHSHDTLLHGRNDVDEADRQHSNIPVTRHMFTGPLAVAEYERMKREIEALKETVHESKKLSRRQAKQLEESRAEANAAVMAMKDREIELVDIKNKCRKNEELLSTIEISVQCQICMDLLDKPFALNSCGHVLCLSCLQEWFRKAPPTLDDMDVDPDELTDPQYVLMRSKTCPSCRATVKHRPVPIFMVKSVVTALKKAKSQHTSSPGSRHNNDYLNAEDNPWKGIFASSEEDEGDDESQVESDSDLGDFGDWYRHSHIARFEDAVEDNATESEVENDDEDGYDDSDLYTHPRWAPPSVSITPADYDGGDDDAPDTVKLLQRGCSWDMLQNFDVSYTHSSGIVVALRSLNNLYASDDDDEGASDINMYRIFLGWNIALHPGDIDGEVYMQQILREIKDVPERWQVAPSLGDPFAMDARRLVCMDEAEEFDTTDTEAWISD